MEKVLGKEEGNYVVMVEVDGVHCPCLYYQARVGEERNAPSEQGCGDERVGKGNDIQGYDVERNESRSDEKGRKHDRNCYMKNYVSENRNVGKVISSHIDHDHSDRNDDDPNDTVSEKIDSGVKGNETYICSLGDMKKNSYET